MRNRKLLNSVLAFTLVFSLIFSQWVFIPSVLKTEAAENVVVWSGNAAESFAGGDGSAKTPYLIENADQLYKMVVDYDSKATSFGKYFRIIKDIYINNVADRTPVQDLDEKQNWMKSFGTDINKPATNNAETLFCGKLDGGGHTIYGLYASGAANAGLFAGICNGAKVENLKFDNLYITGGNGSVGAIGGYGNWGGLNATNYPMIISNCSIVNSTIGTNINNVGGFLGNVSNATINFTNCYLYNTTLEGKNNTGGFVASGYDSSATIRVNNSFSIGYYPIVYAFDNKIFENVYTDIDVPSGVTGVTKLSQSQMQDTAAKTNMSALDFDFTFETVENNYPRFVEFAGGKGTASNPFLIKTKGQLHKVATEYIGKEFQDYYFEILNDIYVNDVQNGTPVENLTSPITWTEGIAAADTGKKNYFYGKLDGGGHTVYGLYSTNAVNPGLFSAIANGAVVENLSFDNIYFTYSGSSSGGVIAGYANYGDYSSKVIKISNCSVTNAKIGTGMSNSGGFIGNGSNASINFNNCYVNKITLSGNNKGGAVASIYTGENDNSKILIKNSYFAGYFPFTTTVANNQYVVTKNRLTFVDAYTDQTIPDGVTSGITKLSTAQMKGAAAKENMWRLDFIFDWQTVTNDYPIFRDFEVWDGNVAEKFAGGSGTAEDPYLIANGGQLYKMVADYSVMDVSKKPAFQENPQPYFKIINNIDLGNKTWYTTSATGWFTNESFNTVAFNGVIYGEGHIIRNLNNAMGVMGLIPVATQGTKIYDLHIRNAEKETHDSNKYAAAAFIGLAKGGGSSTPIIISGCSVENFDILSQNGSAGFVGYSYSQSVTIKDSYCLNSSFVASSASANIGAFIGCLGGNDYGNTYKIENSFANSVSPLITSGDSFLEEISYKNVYTDFADYESSVTGVTKLSTDNFTSSNAKNYLLGFNFNQIWQSKYDGAYPMLSLSENFDDYWNGTADYTFAGGNGTEANPYLISTPRQLYKLATSDTTSTYGKYYKLINNINVSRIYTNWQNDNTFTWVNKTAYLDGFGYGNSFAGTLDGAGYTVSGLYFKDEISNNGSYAYGLFPMVSADAVIKNLTVTNVIANITETKGTAYVGGVAGAVHVTENDVAENNFKMAQFVGVKANNCNITASNKGDILGGASRGVKFELCQATNLIGTPSAENISIVNCDGSTSYNNNVIIYNSLNADASALATIKKHVLGTHTTYITDINGVEDFDIRDLVSADQGIKSINSNEVKETLVWSQEFDGSEIDYSIWSNNTSISYDSTIEFGENHTVNDGSVTLHCSDTGKTDNGKKVYKVNYGLSTIDTMSYKYGRLEMRAKIPYGAGAFPSFWLTSRSAIGYDQMSAYSTEIDIFEIFGDTNSEDKFLACIHKWYNLNGAKTDDECSCGTDDDTNEYIVDTKDRGYTVDKAYQGEWHTFVFEWDENSMTFTIDVENDDKGPVAYYTVSREEVENLVFDKTGYENTGIDGIFEQALCVRVNNHMYTKGTAHTYSGEESEIKPENLDYEIDYIRLYQKNKNGSQINLK